MQFIYIDESGMGQEPIAVMAGIIADSHRMRKTKSEWNELLSNLSDIIGKEIKEIHTSDFYSGNSPWRDLKGYQRSAIITAIFNWLQQRKHSVVFTAVDKTLFKTNFVNEPYFKDIKTYWRFMALHLSLSIQKCHQGTLTKGKERKINPSGHCVLIFDNKKNEEKKLTDLLLSSPDWTDAYYDKRPTQEKFSQIVDVPHFVDSKEVGLIQLADFTCFFLRKYLELKSGCIKPEHDDEMEKLTGWVNLIMDRSISTSNIFPKKGRNDCTDLFYRYAPETIR